MKLMLQVHGFKILLAVILLGGVGGYLFARGESGVEKQWATFNAEMDKLLANGSGQAAGNEAVPGPQAGTAGNTAAGPRNDEGRATSTGSGSGGAAATGEALGSRQGGATGTEPAAGGLVADAASPPAGTQPADKTGAAGTNLPAAPAAKAAAAPGKVSSTAALININSASSTRLMDLPGVGPSKAKAIIAYREEHGPFAAPEDLMKVKGIGQKTFDGLKSRISVLP